MKIIEGTPEEIFKYQEQQNINKNPFAHRQPVKRMPFKFSDAVHWSNTKHEWVQMCNMDSLYITNVLRKMLRENSPKDLLENDEFRAFIVNLGYRIEEEG